MSENATSRDQNILRILYCSVMEEIKFRSEIIIDIMHTKHLQGPYRLRDFAAADLCCIQLRMICELIALACLAAHGDIEATQTGKLLKTYNADVILKDLERLHPNFFPQAQEGFAEVDGRLRVDPMSSGFLTKPELQELYGECGNYLHRGSMKRLLSTDPHRIMSADRVAMWMGKIMRLLSVHIITMIDPKNIVLVIMEGPNKQVAVMSLEVMPDQSR